MKNIRFGLTLLPSLLSLSLGCSTSAPGRVPALIGGELAEPGQFPASIQINRGPGTPTKCTGIAISRTHVLTAAHCLLSYVDGVQQSLGMTFFFSHGVSAEKLLIRGIQNIYIPREAIEFLKQKKAWGAPGVERAQDVAVIELDKELPDAVAIGKMSSRAVSVGTPFRFGGYGCEDPKFVTGGTDILAPIHLKYAPGKVTTVSDLMAQGLTYEGPVSQSACQGDSGGPVYADDAPEYIGINNFHYLVSQGDPVNSQNNFTVITTGSKVGIWVADVLRGKISPAYAY
jgi:hypothetical protein